VIGLNPAGYQKNPVCDECGIQGFSVELRIRCNPRNLKPEYRLLCSRHPELGFQVQDRRRWFPTHSAMDRFA
jgi:hypothetical protein